MSREAGDPAVAADDELAAGDTSAATDPVAADVHPPHLAVREAVARALAEDLLPMGDLTAALIPAATAGRAAFVARSPGVLAGRRCAEEAFAQIDPALAAVWALDDGAPVKAGTVIGEVTGPLRSILTAERTALNFMGHLSGVATLTRRYVDAAHAGNPATRILDTRKTTPGLRALEKAAVRAGGGHNHRGSLSEGVLVKDNHLAGLTITAAVHLAQDRWPGRMLEVECDRLDQVREAIAAGATMILLDNMTPDQVAAAVALAVEPTEPAAGGAGPDQPAGREAGAGRAPRGPRAQRPLFEISGRVSLEDAPAYAAAGADFISVGALTHSAPVLDIGLDLGA